ncbi:hypothetical protein [Alkalicoccobacillus plakortidis]|uniref:Uncharacterized protein n=1 Tax=Alkalicoccobacillus plakortidis TaxID=444060 RepID=A0ABT0XGN2_9BACI|nr:hypothetical protein [Alkalicoccobacillus plakortidis]MCM2675053.1 hypothetical protein [Alkalicoccobacillus plakortidis]
MKLLTWIGKISLILVAFMFYLFGLMKMFPVMIGAFLLFGSILFAFRPALKTNRFKGFRS